MQIRKIPLEQFIQILQELYDGGADFIDITNETIDNEVKQDSMKLVVRPEYMTEDLEEDIEENIDLSDKSLSDEDINELL